MRPRLQSVPGWEASIRSSLLANDMLLPLLVTVAAVTGMVLQHSEVLGKSAGEEDAEAQGA